jgi:hypothetical protein
MEAKPLWYVLVMDWTAVENTPPSTRRPLEMQRWHLRVERLARMVGRPSGELAQELKAQAREVARRQRKELEAALAEDMAVSRAQGQKMKPPWRRKMQALAEINGQPFDDLRQRVADAASLIRVVEAR